jgi:hypothetical protein
VILGVSIDQTIPGPLRKPSLLKHNQYIYTSLSCKAPFRTIVSILQEFNTRTSKTKRGVKSVYFVMLMKDGYHVKWVPCHHGMARPQVADGGGGLQIWRVAANILNKQSRIADNG